MCSEPDFGPAAALARLTNLRRLQIEEYAGKEWMRFVGALTRLTSLQARSNCNEGDLHQLPASLERLELGRLYVDTGSSDDYEEEDSEEEEAAAQAQDTQQQPGLRHLTRLTQLSLQPVKCMMTRMVGGLLSGCRRSSWS
uniref:Uncharacterized protein n=1 Tax=Tetradesmus obliquus TaxID=3088 RepID=A0A383WEG0_TETOB|eukprot:jgi/Sobl393_1/18719/SZX75998.1